VPLVNWLGAADSGSIRSFTGVQQSRPALAEQDRLDWKTRVASAAVGSRDVAGGDFFFVGGERCQDFGLLWFRAPVTNNRDRDPSIRRRRTAARVGR